MRTTSIATLAAVALAVTAAAAPLVLAVLRRAQVLDRPNARSLHDRPTPRGGGLAPAMGACLALALYDGGGTAVLVAAVLFGAVGLADDVRGIGVAVRLVVQSVLAVGLALVLADGAVWAVAAAVFVVGYVNAFNFMDGINGIAGAQAVVAGAAWWAVGQHEGEPLFAAMGAVVALAAIGFLPFNFPRAAMFLGDVGSYFLGAWLAGAAVVGVAAGVPVEAVGAPLAVFGADTAWTLVRRVRAGEPWHQAHRDHAYQRLTLLGWSHLAVTSFAAAVMAVCAVLGAVSLTDSPVLRAAADAGICLAVVAYLAAPRLRARVAV